MQKFYFSSKIETDQSDHAKVMSSEYLINFRATVHLTRDFRFTIPTCIGMTPGIMGTVIPISRQSLWNLRKVSALKKS